MTAPPDEHDVSPSFSWDDRYRDQLEHLADTDEMTDDIRWPDLKDAIKYLLSQSFAHYPSSTPTVLHPAASLIAIQRASGSGRGSTSSATSASDSSSSSSASGTSEGATTSAEPSSAAQNVGGGGTFGAQRLSNGTTNLRSSSGGEASDNKVDTSTSSEDMAGHSRAPRAQHEGHGTSVKEADMQAFFPSKRQAPAEWGGSWGKRFATPSEVAKERRMTFMMLDDFEGQPPFTIQRLAELVLHPTEHHHTLPKYVSALKRLLSVTATRDAFPSVVGDEDDDELAGESVAMEPESLQNGSATPMSTGSSRSRSSSVVGSPRTAPLFSPIPFLMKSGDEGMPGAGPAGRGQDGQARTASADDRAVDDRDVPSMELGGADRTTEEATQHARRIGAGVGTSKSLHEAGDVPNEDVHQQAHSTAPISSDNQPPRLDGEEKMGAGATSSGPGSAGTLASDSASGGSATPVSGTEPLGVPAGPVDEVDQAGDMHGQLQPLKPGSVAGGARAFSSTTSSAPSVEEASVPAHSSETPANGSTSRDSALAPAATTAAAETPADAERALKRARSDRDLKGGGEDTQHTMNGEQAPPELKAADDGDAK